MHSEAIRVAALLRTIGASSRDEGTSHKEIEEGLAILRSDTKARRECPSGLHTKLGSGEDTQGRE